MAQSLCKLIFSQLVIALAVLTTSAQQSVPIREQKQLRAVDYAGDMLALLTQLPGAYDVTLGFEIDVLEPRSYIVFGVRDATIDDLMDAIVKANPRYRWRRSESAIEVYPNQRGHSLLETKISSFRVTDVTAIEALHQLLAAPAIQSAMTSSQLQLASSENLEKNLGKRFSMDLKDESLREALNRIATDSGLRFWVFQTSGPRREFVSIRFVGQN
jgi:hypothetical protein